MSFAAIRGIVQTTTFDGVRQPIFLLLSLLSLLLVILSPAFTMFGLGNVEINMVREMGLSNMRLLGFLIAVFLGLGGFCEEIERRRLFTILSKPVRRADVVIGRYLGVMMVTAVACVVMSLAVIGAVWWVEGTFDARIFLGMGFGYVQTAVLVAVAHLLAVLMPFLPGAIGCLGVFAIGHLSNWLVGLATDSAAYWPARGVQAVFPNLQHFNVVTAIASHKPLDGTYVSLTLLYAVGYIAVTLGLAIVLFQRREVA